MILLYLVLTYLVAAVPWGLVLTTLLGGDADIRASGSGNIGATNVARVYGWRFAAPVLVLDLLKGLLPVLFAQLLWPGVSLLWLTLIASVAFIAHCKSVFLEFRGGKGVATGAGAMLALAPLPTLGAGALWVTLLLVSGRSSVASLGAAVALVGGMAWLDATMLPVAALLGIGIAWTHTANIRRLVRGEESQVMRPVRWGRSTREANPADLLTQAPAGSARGPAVWLEDVGDPLDTDVSEEIEPQA